jgi:hypothetical protein
MNTTEPIHQTADHVPDNSSESLGAKWFFFTSLVFLLLGSLMLAGRPQFLLTPVLTGHGFSWLLLLLFGCGLPGVFGVVYWAIPKVFGLRLYSEKFVFLHYGFHYVGFLLVLISVIWPGFGRADMGMTFIACGALALGINLARTFHQPAKPDVASAFLAASVLWLLVIALLGVPFAEKAPLSVLEGSQWSAAWLLLALTGVLLNLPMGLALRVTPFVLGAPVTKTGTAWYALAFSNAGLAWMFPAAAFGPPAFLLFCALIYVFGVLLFFARYFSILQNRTVRVLPWDGKILLTSFSLVPVAGCLLLFSAWEHLQIQAAARAAALAPELAGALPDLEEAVAGGLPLEFLPIDGALVLTCILGIAVPAVVALGFGLMRLEKRSSRAVPAAPSWQAHLAEQILLAAYFNYACGVLLVIPGAWLGIGQMLGLGSLFLVVGSLGFLGNAIFASHHPLREPPATTLSPHPLRT